MEFTKARIAKELGLINPTLAEVNEKLNAKLDQISDCQMQALNVGNMEIFEQQSKLNDYYVEMWCVANGESLMMMS